jgi:PAS domain S-box-containing protein
MTQIELPGARAKRRKRAPGQAAPGHPKPLDLQDFFEHGSVALHLVGPDGTILHANKAELELLGYCRKDYVGRDIREFHEDQDAILDILERLGRGEQISKYPARLRAKDGSIRHVEITSSAQFKDGQFANTRCFTVDVTDLVRARAEVRQKDDQLRQVLDALPAAVYTTDAAGKLTYYNRAAVELAGREPVIGQDEWCVTYRLRLPDGTPLPHDQCPMAVALKENRPVRGVEAVAEKPDGTLVSFLPFPTPLRSETGDLIGAVNMLVDISERKEAEGNQRVLLNELNHRVKNNLQMLVGLLNGAQREASSAEAKQIINDAALRVSAMAAAQQLLYTDVNPGMFQIGDFLRAVCEIAQQVFDRPVDVTIEADPGHLGNETSMPLALIVNELLTNAAKYGADEHGRVRINISLRREDGNVVLCVADDGPGFDLGEPGRRASGLGLVMGLARQLLGRLKVEKGRGARCIVTFPEPRRHC